ncbi:hypothetical protein P4571_08600 [Niallia alba]|uniref:hypothetical protein n=1 Tax=Niallia alba TaxID=2729105 RepID=UPI002E239CC9|nr:hypothetical protein [Niallia alba]
MREIKSIGLSLENCEAMEFKREDIGRFNIIDIKRSISRSASNSVSDYLTSEEVYLQLSSKANKYSTFTCTWHDGEVTPFERLLQHKDIVAIDINYEDGTNEYIYVKWKGESDYTNEIETVKMNDHTGDLYIVISENENVESYFRESLEEEEAITWYLYLEE